ncbi:MAG: hypothetical protein H8E21_15905 [Gammaproteobacteria bacterium]|nr:hypothetical protein [Gammaproteobacteria bacterium]
MNDDEGRSFTAGQSFLVRHSGPDPLSSEPATQMMKESCFKKLDTSLRWYDEILK